MLVPSSHPCTVPKALIRKDLKQVGSTRVRVQVPLAEARYYSPSSGLLTHSLCLAVPQGRCVAVKGITYV